MKAVSVELLIFFFTYLVFIKLFASSQVTGMHSNYLEMGIAQLFCKCLVSIKIT